MQRHRLVIGSTIIATTLAIAGGATAQLGSSGPIGKRSQSSTGQRDVETLRLSGSDTVVRYWQGGYSISRGGNVIAEVNRPSTRVRLRYASFDPLEEVPEVPVELQQIAVADGAQPYIVQFVTQPLEDYREAIRDAGGTIYNFLADQGYIVMLDQEALERVTAMSFVRWVGPYHPAYRLDEALFAGLTSEDAGLGVHRYRIVVFERGLRQKLMVEQEIRTMGGQIDLVTPNGFILEATLTPAQLMQVVSLPQVMWVDLWSPPEMDLDHARDLTGSDFVETVAGYDGTGVRGEVMDGNLFNAHQDFQHHPPIIHGNRAGSTWHGTLTFGEIFGDGTGRAASRGMLPNAQGIFADFGQFTDRFAHTEELVQSPYFAVFQSNSWGSSRTTSYNSFSMEMDDIIFNLDIVITQSQSNANSRNSRPQAWAKNIVAVGGINTRRTQSRADDFWNGASIGPAADGRIKPDLSHIYDGVIAPNNSGSYESICCTSGATPLVAGSFGIFFQMWSDGVFGNDVDPNGTVFENRSRFTTAKAAIINSAFSYPFSGTGHNLTRTHQGWGMPDLQRLYESRENMLIVNEDRVLENLDVATYEVLVAADEPEFRATMVYADPPGTTSSNLHRINDLTLKVTSPGGVTYWGNNGLREGNESTPGGSPNTIDTVENVFIQNPESGNWTIEVIASEINQDAHLETAGVDADFALVVAGITPQNNIAQLDDVEVIFGDLLAGGVQELRESDDETFDVRSIIGFSATDPNIVRVRLGFTGASADPSTMNILIEGRLDNPGGIGRLRVRDWSTNLFNAVSTYDVGLEETIHVAEDIDATNRVRGGDRRVEVEYRQVVVATFSATGFTSMTDHVEVMTN